MAGLMIESFPAPAALPPLDAAAWPHGMAVAGTEPTTLFAILRPEVNLAIWHRPMPTRLSAALRPLLMAAPFTAMAEGEIDAALVALAGKLPAPPPLDLMFDLQDLATAFAAVAATRGKVCLRLEAITGRGCHRWHADAVGLRLLCTYRGPGTEWLALPGGAGTARALAPGSPAPIPPSQMPAGAAAILKGEGHPGNAGAGCIHRAPPAGSGNRARLLLCIDEPGRIPLDD